MSVYPVHVCVGVILAKAEIQYRHSVPAEDKNGSSMKRIIYIALVVSVIVAGMAIS